MKSRLLVLIFTGVIVAIVTVLTYSDLGTFLFNRGSDMFAVRRLGFRPMLMIAAIAVIAPASMLRVRSSAPFMLVLSVSLLTWSVCGRVVAETWDARIAGGWFFFRTSTISLYEPGDNDSYAKLWHVTVLPGWRIQLRRSSGRAERLFVGPAMLRASLDFFKSRGYEVDSHI